MTFSSYDDFFSEITASTPKIMTRMWNKLTGGAAYTKAQWYDTFSLVGTPNPGTYGSTSTTLAFQQCSDTTTGAWYIGGDKTPDTRHIAFAEFIGPLATQNPSWVLIVDVLGYYSGLNANSSATQTTNSTAGVNVLPNRQGTQDGGAGVRAFCVAAGTIGATAANLSMTYTNSAGTSGKTLPVTVTTLASAITPHIFYTGTSLNMRQDPFLPLAAGDNGIQSVQDFKLTPNTGTAVAFTIVLCRPLMWVPLNSQGPIGRDGMFGIPQLPQVPDGACLSGLVYAGAAAGATGAFFGTYSLAWG